MHRLFCTFPDLSTKKAKLNQPGSILNQNVMDRAYLPLMLIAAEVMIIISPSGENKQDGSNENYR